MTADIHQLPEPLNKIGERIDAAFARAQRGNKEWVEESLELAQSLAEARDRFPSDNAFGAWLGENGHDHVGHQNRAALIHFGRNPPRARIVFEETLRTSYQLIWEDVKSWFTSASKPVPESASEATVTVFPSPQPPTAPSDTGIVHTTDSRPVKLNKQHSFHDLPRGAEIAKVFSSKEAPYRIGHALKGRHGKEIWELMLQCYDAGFLRDSKYAPGGTPNLSLMLLFPRTPVPYAKRYMVTDQKDRDTIRDRIIPAAMAYRDELLAAPDSLEQIVQRHERVTREQAAAKAREQRLETARQKLSPTEPEVILYGHFFWPIIDIADPDQRYDYATLAAAAWFFADALALAMGSKEDNSPRSCGMKIRFLVKRFSLFNKTSAPHDPSRARWMKVFHLVHEMTRLLEKHGHDAATGNRMPFLPSED
jgi:hypothetical protein